MAELVTPDEDQREQFARILQHAFAIADVEGQRKWFASAGHENLRVWIDGPVKAGLLIVPMGQYFGGAAVPMMGIASVGERSDALRRGHATEMMAATLREGAARRMGISTLYASTLSLYRRVGYDAAGCRFLARLRPQDIPIAASQLHPRGMEPTDDARMKSLYDAHASRTHGFLQRGSYIWPRLVSERFGVPAHGLLFEDDDGQLQAYITYRKHVTPNLHHRIEVADWFATTVQGHHHLWT